MTYIQELDPTTCTTIYIKAFKNVKNIQEIKGQLLSGNLECCVCKLSLILDPFQIVIAANKAVTAEKITTKSVYTEILFNLSPSKNISQSLQKFGINDSVDSIAVAVLVKEGDKTSKAQEIFKKIDGVEVDSKLFNEMANKTEIQKVYRISDSELKELPLLDSMITRIAVKDLM